MRSQGPGESPASSWARALGPAGRARLPDRFARRRVRSRWTGAILLAVCVALTVAAWGASLHARGEALRDEEHRTQTDLEHRATGVLRTIEDLAQEAQHEFAGLATVDPGALETFIASRELVAHETGVIGIVFTNAALGSLGTTVTYAEPTGVTSTTTVPAGFVQAATDALTRARDTGRPALSDVFVLPTLRANSTSAPRVFEVSVPSYAGVTVPTTVADRRARLLGWMTALVDADFFAREVLARTPRVERLEIFDGATTAPAASVVTFEAPSDGAARGPVRTSTVRVLDHTWTLRSRAEPSHETAAIGDARRLLLLAGLILSLLVFVIAELVRRSERRAYRMVDEATSNLLESEERFRALVNESSDIIVVIDENARLLYSSPAGERLLGHRVEDSIGRPGLELVHPDDRERVTAALGVLLVSPRVNEPVELRLCHADGHYLTVEAVGTNLLDNPAVGGLVINLRDITERKRAEAALDEARERFASAFEHAPIGMAIGSLDARILRANRALGDLLGREPEDLVDTPIREITHPDDWEVSELEMRRLLAGEIDSYHTEKRYLHADGRPVWAALSVSLVRDVEGRALYMIGQIEDITERKAIGERLAHQAIHDPMTGLPNRVLFMDRLTLALSRAVRRGSRVAVLFLDLDRFKLINDGAGHAVGDQVLVAIADRLRGALRPSDTVARFGGDEFTVLCDDVADELTATEVARRMLAAIASPLVLPGGEVFVTASLGIALSGPDDTPDTLLRDADTAMYRAKEQGRARVEVFDRLTHDQAVDSLRTGNALHRALERGEFELFYQPIVSLETGRVSGFEALLRWQHPERGLVHPAEFIALAEETGLIVPIGLWVLEEACGQIAHWQRIRAGGEPLTISVNLAPRQLTEPMLPDEVARVIARTGIAPSAVWLEITESTLMHDAESAVGALRALRAQGVHLSVDDFGTGYSSLSYLKRFPVEALKVDQSFVDGLGREPEDSAIVSAVVSLAHALGLTCVAEGLETTTQLGELRKLGCDMAQGFLFGHPEPACVIGERPADDLRSWHRTEKAG